MGSQQLPPRETSEVPKILRALAVSALIRRVTGTLKAFHFSVLLSTHQREREFQSSCEKSGKEEPRMRECRSCKNLQTTHNTPQCLDRLIFHLEAWSHARLRG